MKTRTIYILLIIIGVLFASCRRSTVEVVTPIEEEGISVVRYDKLLNEYVQFNSFSALQKMNTEYMQPTKILIEDVLNIGLVSDDKIIDRLKIYYSDTTLVRLMTDVVEKYPDLEEVEKGLTKGFRNLQKEIPDIVVPTVYSQVSALNESIVLTDSLLGISLDKYMGEDYPLYKRFYYDYQRRSMRPERILPDCFVFYLMSQYTFPMEHGRTLLDVMLHYGKLYYVVREVLDYHSSEEVMGYSEVEKKWCKENMSLVWEYILKNDHLHATDPMIVRRYTKPSPFSTYFGEDAPGLIGTWLGTKVIASYMKHHKKTTLKELLEMTDYELLFNEARFQF